MIELICPRMEIRSDKMAMNHVLQWLFPLTVYCLHFAKGNSGLPSIDDHLENRYQFELFENHEACIEVYYQEAKVVKQLFQVKERLFAIKETLQNNGIDTLDMYLKNLNNKMKSHSTALNYYKTITKKLGTFFPNYNDYKGSIKGIFILHYSYGINVTEAVLDGILSFYNHQMGNFKKYQVIVSSIKHIKVSLCQ